MAIRVLFLAANLPVFFFCGLALEVGSSTQWRRVNKRPQTFGIEARPTGLLQCFLHGLYQSRSGQISQPLVVPLQHNSGISSHLHLNRSRLKRDESSDSDSTDPSFPFTVPSGPCESKTKELCDICPATTRLGPDRIPEYINVRVCKGKQSCGEMQGSVRGECKNSSVSQIFLKKKGVDVDDWETYPQEISLCCECVLI